MKAIFIAAFLLFTVCLHAQDSVIHSNTSDTNKHAEKIAHEAMFPGGFDAWHRFIEKNINTKTPKKIMHHPASIQ